MFRANIYSSSTRSGKKPVLFTFKSYTDIPPKFLNYTVGKFWSKVTEHPGTYIKQSEINHKTVPLVVLVPEEILARIFHISWIFPDLSYG